MSKPRPRTRHDARAERKKQARKQTSAAKQSKHKAQRAAASSPPRLTKEELKSLDEVIHRREHIAYETVIRAQVVFRVGNKLLAGLDAR